MPFSSLLLSTTSLIPRLTGTLTCHGFYYIVLLVSRFLEGERDYSKLKGDTGPLVYPAGFLYAYSAIQYVTAGEVYSAQIWFDILYIINLAIVLFIYVKTDVLPWWALSLLCLSKRAHLIFVLRLFNDCFAMTFLHAALALFLYQSVAVSIKMNVLLCAPPLLRLLFKSLSISSVISALAGAALVQILIELPFLISHLNLYISRAFDLGRVFIHFWSVNFKFVPEPIFISKEFAISLLITHLLLLTAFAHYRWCKYFYSLPYLLWRTSFPTLLRLILFIGVEFCWNVYPSNICSSLLLLCLHVVILWGLWSAPLEYPYTDDKSSVRKNK